MRPASLPRLTRFLLTGCLIAAAVPAQAQKCCKPELHREAGLSITTFTTPSGAIRVFLPDDMAVGDTVSGTVASLPSLEPNRIAEQSLAELAGYVVEAEGQQVSTGGRKTFRMPGIGKQVTLVLRDSGGQEVTRQAVPVLAAGQAKTSCAGHDLFMTAGHDIFLLPTIGQAGQPLQICGPFDGNLGTTGLSIGGQAARALAESPRRALFEAPAMRPGTQALELNKGGRRSQGSIQLLILSLSAPKTVLQRGETTTLTVLVSGLDGLQQPVPLEVVNRSTSVVTLEGGDRQVIPITPSPGQSQMTITRTVTGLQPGAFDIRAQLQVAAAETAGGSTDAGKMATPTPGSETPAGKGGKPSDTSTFCLPGSPGKPTGKPSSERPLLCRGTIEMLLVDRPYGDPGAMGDTYLWGTFTPNATEAGDSGEKLAPGTCAWPDAGIASGQPNQFLYEFSSTTPKLAHRASLIEHCASDSACVFEVCASFYAYYPPVWLIDASKMRIVFPKF